MIFLRPAAERGITKISWLESYHTFSFNDYDDPRFRGFSDLLVLNDDYIAPSSGFPTHGHRDMEILTCVLQGSLAHRDSMGNERLIPAGQWQRMTAGNGVTHSEYNPSTSEPVHLYQIWIKPHANGLGVGYQDKIFDPAGRQNQWQLIASRNARNDSLTIHQDCEISQVELQIGKSIDLPCRPECQYWLQVCAGDVQVNQHQIHLADGLAYHSETGLQAIASSTATLLLFELRR